MKYQLVLAVFVTTCASLVASSTGQGEEDVVYGKCRRVIPLLPWRSSYRLTCRYLCRGWPIRYENEPDGIPCGPFGAFFNRVCNGGKCVRAASVESTTSGEDYVTTLPPTVTEAQATTEERYTSEEDTTISVYATTV
ncbi:uncharacterized protein [Dermacentor albipictus]|uniref:uncharacterized protein n=1 Tax=Dermacentor albipictus TaxID=60249 RepID=UPI0038FC180C